MKALEWYPKGLERVDIPAAIKKEAVQRHKANERNRILIKHMNSYVGAAFKFFQVEKYEATKR